MDLEIRGLQKAYGPHSVLNSVSFKLAPGERLCIFGPSGCGKSTLLRVIAGLELPSSGEVFLNGSLASDESWALEPHRRDIGFVFQSPALWPHMTVAQNVLFGMRRWTRSAAQERLDELLTAVELERFVDRFPDELSGGEARRVSLIRSLAPRPGLLLLDEPLTNLDSELKGRTLSFICRSLEESGAALIYVSHDHTEAGPLSAHTVEMISGRVEHVPAGVE